MRRLPLAIPSLVSSLAPTLVLTGAVAWLNPRLSWRDVAAVGADLWVVSLALVGLPLALQALVFRARRRRVEPGDVYALTAIWLFALLWLARLEPAHQPISIRPHLSAWGAVELGAIAACAAAIAAAWRGRRLARLPRWATVPAAFAAASIGLMLLAHAIEPPRRRDEPLALVARQFPAHRQAIPATTRVLVIGIDGLEWRTVEWMTAHGRMPAVASLLRTGRFFQHDNEALTYSAEIWTSMWTGRPSADNDVGDFAKWQFAGATHPVVFLPRFGMHGLWFIDEILRRSDQSPLWIDESTSTADILTAPLWAIASAAGKRVGIFEPVPQGVVPEKVNGFFGADDGDGLEFFWTTQGVTRREEIRPDPQAAAGEFGADREVARIVGQQFARERFDLGLFYTHLVDSTQHTGWDFRLNGGFLGGDPRVGLGPRFDATSIRRAYDEVDQEIAGLVAGFGQPATVVLVSDHGFRYDDYEHFRNPFGMLVIAPTADTGYGGDAGLRSITPTILSLLGIPLDPTMSAPLAGFPSRRSEVTYASTVPRHFVEHDIDDTARRERLRSLGYVEGQPRRVRPPTP